MKFWQLPFNCSQWRDSESRLTWSLEERLVYLELLVYQWVNGQVPDGADMARVIARAAFVPEDVAGRVWPVVRRKFVLEQGRGWVNPELEKIRGDKIALGKRRVAYGRAGGKANAIAHARDLLKQKPSKHLLVSSSSVFASEENCAQKQEGDLETSYWAGAEMEDWLEKHYEPSRQAGPWRAVLSELLSLDGPGVCERIKGGVLSWQASEQWRNRQFICNLGTFLSERRFERPPAAEGEDYTKLIEEVKRGLTQ